MELINPLENPIEIINPGNGLPGIAPCQAVYDSPIENGGGICGSSYGCGRWAPKPGAFE